MRSDVQVVRVDAGCVARAALRSAGRLGALGMLARWRRDGLVTVAEADAARLLLEAR